MRALALLALLLAPALPAGLLPEPGLVPAEPLPPTPLPLPPPPIGLPPLPLPPFLPMPVVPVPRPPLPPVLPPIVEEPAAPAPPWAAPGKPTAPPPHGGCQQPSPPEHREPVHYHVGFWRDPPDLGTTFHGARVGYHNDVLWTVSVWPDDAEDFERRALADPNVAWLTASPGDRRGDGADERCPEGTPVPFEKLRPCMIPPPPYGKAPWGEVFRTPEEAAVDEGRWAQDIAWAPLSDSLRENVRRHAVACGSAMFHGVDWERQMVLLVQWMSPNTGHRLAIARVELGTEGLVVHVVRDVPGMGCVTGQALMGLHDAVVVERYDGPIEFRLHDVQDDCTRDVLPIPESWLAQLGQR